MITVKTYLGPDEYGGKAVYADAPIAKGDIVWRYEESSTRIITVEEYKHIMEVGGTLAHTLKTYCYPGYMEINGVNQRALFHDQDHGSFMNHSDTPNTGFITALNHPHYKERDEVNIALRDIAQGEALTFDYFAFVDNLDEWQDIETCMQFLIDMGHPRTKNLRHAS